MSEIKLYNTLTNKVEPFKPMTPGKVKMYTCGPTVYSHPHIGNYKSFLMADVLKRFLEYMGYEVLHVMNITDVGHLVNDADEGEDKMEAEAKKQKKAPLEIAEVYIKSFDESNKLLNIKPANVFPRATEHIQEMIDIIEKLIEKGYAYQVDSNVYYDITKFKEYGKLSNNTLEDLNAGARVDVNDEKRNPHDFALWKYDPKHIQKWPSPWSEGFPGWHIECSAMSSKYLGEEFDIHTGGEDNIFPHHECEIAQSEAANGRKYVHYWLHGRHLMVDGDKMSKSKGNFYTIPELVEKGFKKAAIRYALISAHYNQNYNFTFDGLKAAEQAVDKINQFAFVMCDNASKGTSGEIRDEVKTLSEAAIKDFGEALSYDLNMSKGLAVCFDFIKASNKITNLNSAEASLFVETMKKLDSVIGVLEVKSDDIPEEIKTLAQERADAKKAKDWARADEIRDELSQKGFVVEDIPGGFRIKLKGD